MARVAQDFFIAQYRLTAINQFSHNSSPLIARFCFQNTNDFESSGDHRWNDGDPVRFLDSSCILAQLANVLILQIDADKRAQMNCFPAQVRSSVGIKTLMDIKLLSESLLSPISS
jgi:hypothetical protein